MFYYSSFYTKLSFKWIFTYKISEHVRVKFELECSMNDMQLHKRLFELSVVSSSSWRTSAVGSLNRAQLSDSRETVFRDEHIRQQAERAKQHKKLFKIYFYNLRNCIKRESIKSPESKYSFTQNNGIVATFPNSNTISSIYLTLPRTRNAALSHGLPAHRRRETLQIWSLVLAYGKILTDLW